MLKETVTELTQHVEVRGDITGLRITAVHAALPSGASHPDGQVLVRVYCVFKKGCSV